MALLFVVESWNPQAITARGVEGAEDERVLRDAFITFFTRRAASPCTWGALPCMVGEGGQRDAEGERGKGGGFW
eukprot:scaffold16838_cov24-Tisochrysis_lutea.AAC.1